MIDPDPPLPLEDLLHHLQPGHLPDNLPDLLHLLSRLGRPPNPTMSRAELTATLNLNVLVKAATHGLTEFALNSATGSDRVDLLRLLASVGLRSHHVALSTTSNRVATHVSWNGAPMITTQTTTRQAIASLNDALTYLEELRSNHEPLPNIENAVTHALALLDSLPDPADPPDPSLTTAGIQHPGLNQHRIIHALTLLDDHLYLITFDADGRETSRTPLLTTPPAPTAAHLDPNTPQPELYPSTEKPLQ